MAVQLVLFFTAMLLLLFCWPATSAQVQEEDKGRKREETPSQTRMRHALEIGVVALFWIGIAGLWITTLTGLAIARG